MKAVKAIYEQGKIELFEKPVEQGPVEVLVVFPEEADDRWQSILSEKTPRPSFQAFVDQCQLEIKQGRSNPLVVEDL